MIDFNHAIIDEFRANQGKVGGPFEGARLILLTTTGARTGRSHTVPLGYLPDGGDRLLVIGSAAGGPRHPAWYYNLIAHPRATIEDGVFRYRADAEVLTGAVRDVAFARAVESDPGWGAYQEKTSRLIPVIALTGIAEGPPELTVSSGAEMLTAVHDGFRTELARIRRDLDGGGPRVGAQLRINCLTVCAGLHNHHTGEDQMMFPMLADRHPELAPVIDRLTEEHRTIAALVDELQQVINDDMADHDRLTTEVDRLCAELEGHLRYEEEQLIPLLG